MTKKKNTAIRSERKHNDSNQVAEKKTRQFNLKEGTKKKHNDWVKRKKHSDSTWVYREYQQQHRKVILFHLRNIAEVNIDFLSPFLVFICCFKLMLCGSLCCIYASCLLHKSPKMYCLYTTSIRKCHRWTRRKKKSNKYKQNYILEMVIQALVCTTSPTHTWIRQ